MATRIKLPTPKLFHEALPIIGANDRTRMALRGCIGEWDMQTRTGSVLTDLSGAGHNFTFSASPNVTSTGIDFGGTNYADTTISPAMVKDFTMAIVLNAGDFGYYAFSNANDSDHVGVSFRPAGFGGGCDIEGPFANFAYGPGSVGQWTSAIATFANGLGKNMSLKGGRSTMTMFLREMNTNEMGSRTLWRLGGSATTSGGNHDAVQAFTFRGTIAYALLFNVVKSYAEIAAINDYLKPKLAARGITSYA
jgi:hypothetical protein